MIISNGNNLSRVKVTNQNAIREIIYHYGPISRRDIAGRLSLTLPTITTNINVLLEKGLLKEIQDEPGETSKSNNLGRKTTYIDIAEDSRKFIGIEMRGSCRRACITNYRGKVLASVKKDTVQSDYRTNLNETIQMVLTMLKKSGIKKESISGIGICTPGIVDSQAGTLKVYPRYNWHDKRIRDDIAQGLEFDGPVVVENNVVSRAYAMRMFYQDMLSNATNFTYMFVSHGIACPLFSNEIGPQKSIMGFGEAGHMVMNPDGPVCSCGNRGCLEVFSSEKAIITQCKEAIKKTKDSYLRKHFAKPSEPTIWEIIEAQKNDDPTVSAIIDSAIQYLATAISNIYNFIAPDLMVVECVLFSETKNRTRLLKLIHKGLYNPKITSAQISFMEHDPLSGAKGAAARIIETDLQTYTE